VAKKTAAEAAAHPKAVTITPRAEPIPANPVAPAVAADAPATVPNNVAREFNPIAKVPTTVSIVPM